MKFQRKPGLVDVGLTRPQHDPRFLMPPPGPPPPPELVVITEMGKAFQMPFDQLKSEYEPADDDARAFLEGLEERMAAPPPQPQLPMGVLTDLPPDLFEKNGAAELMDKFDVVMDNSDPDCTVMKFRRKKKPEKKAADPRPPLDDPRTPPRPPTWPADLPWPPRIDGGGK